ncbi:hypothetical protein J2T60_001886 [Natronospira proteinivora]|uniref:Uncharacterized protein n=1 Tax=Natronospira proteinivora TaxID=1807133 RepID=A0ABT1G983_9GAMM|nr:hypothetical protein [Natronospira proteinivora]MCP1727886.1 hypothetical protein [Natronospira proteinivora]
MRLFSSTWQFLRWHFAVMGAFMAIHPVMTPVLVWSKATANITRILAFFIPLKVLLLLATPGVPRYFRFFIEPELRNEWAIGLSIAAVVAYLLTLVLDKLSENLSEKGSQRLLAVSNQLSVVQNQKELAKRYFSSFSDVSASFLLASILLLAGFLIHPWLFVFTTGVIVLMALVSWAALRTVEPREPRGFGGYILGNLGSYLGYLYAILFLAVFSYLVIDFLLFDGINVLIAILSFLIARQLLSALSGAVSTAVSLSGQRSTIDPLVFLEEQHVKQARSAFQDLQYHYTPERREARIRELLNLHADDDALSVSSHWVDPLRGMYLFLVQAENGAGETVFRGLEQVVPFKQAQNLDNEDLIRDHMGAGPLRLADVRSEYEVAGFRCRLYELGEGQALSRNAWKRHALPLTLELWQLEPPQALCSVFELSQPYLGQRFSPELLERMELALDDPEKCELFAELTRRLDEIRDRLNRIPLFPYNAGLSEKTAFADDDGDLTLTDWGKWSLEPVGVGVAPTLLTHRRMDAVFDKLRARKDCPDDLGLDDLRIACLAYRIEDLVQKKSAFNAAFTNVEKLLSYLDGPAEVPGDAEGVVNG